MLRRAGVGERTTPHSQLFGEGPAITSPPTPKRFATAAAVPSSSAIFATAKAAAATAAAAALYTTRVRE